MCLCRQNCLQNEILMTIINNKQFKCNKCMCGEIDLSTLLWEDDIVSTSKHCGYIICDISNLSQYFTFLFRAKVKLIH